MSQTGGAWAPACPALPGCPGWAHLPLAPSLSSHTYGSACPSQPAGCLGCCPAQGPSHPRWEGWEVEMEGVAAGLGRARQARVPGTPSTFTVPADRGHKAGGPWLRRPLSGVLGPQCEESSGPSHF